MELPKTKHVPSTELSDYVLLFAGEKKIGKTSIANEFPEAFIVECEPGNADHIECYREDVGTWNKFEQCVGLLEKEPTRFKTIVLDEIPNLFRYCEAQVCKELAIDSLGDAGWGKGWNALRNKMLVTLARLQSLPVGVIYTAHTAVKEFTDRTGRKQDRLEINAGKMLNEILDSNVNTWLVFVYDAEGNRHCICQGDSFIKAGVGLPGRFRTTDGHLLKTFPLGESPQQAYQNIIRAFNNGYDSTGSENYEQPIFAPKTTNQAGSRPTNTTSNGTLSPGQAKSKFVK